MHFKDNPFLISSKRSKFTLQVTSLVPQPDGYIIHLFNAGGNPTVIDLAWRENPKEVFFCDFDGNRTGDYINGTAVPAWGIRTIRVRK